MKIIHVITNLKVGGAQRLLVDILPILNESNVVDLLVIQDADTQFSNMLIEKGIKIRSLQQTILRDPRCIVKMRRIFKEYDIVHVHLFPTIYFAALASLGLSLKLIYTEHNTTNSRRGKWYFHGLEKYIYSKYNRIISISQQVQNAITQWLQEYDDRFKVICNGVDLDKFRKPDIEVLPNTLIMVSRFGAAKDQATVIRALPYIQKNAILSFVGDGPNRHQCELLAQQLGVSDRIKFLGTRSDVAELISMSYIGIQSSNWEGFGLTAVEIMAAGKPIIASSVEGLKQVVEGAGITFAVGNERELADEVNRLLSDRRYYESIKTKCVDRSFRYDIKTMINEYKKVYDEVYTAR